LKPVFEKPSTGIYKTVHGSTGLKAGNINLGSKPIIVRPYGLWLFNYRLKELGPKLKSKEFLPPLRHQVTKNKY